MAYENVHVLARGHVIRVWSYALTWWQNMQLDNLFETILELKNIVELKNIYWSYWQQVNYEKAHKLTIVTITTET